MRRQPAMGERPPPVASVTLLLNFGEDLDERVD